MRSPTDKPSSTVTRPFTSTPSHTAHKAKTFGIRHHENNLLIIDALHGGDRHDRRRVQHVADYRLLEKRRPVEEDNADVML